MGIQWPVTMWMLCLSRTLVDEERSQSFLKCVGSCLCNNVVFFLFMTMVDFFLAYLIEHRYVPSFTAVIVPKMPWITHPTVVDASLRVLTSCAPLGMLSLIFLMSVSHWLELFFWHCTLICFFLSYRFSSSLKTKCWPLCGSVDVMKIAKKSSDSVDI